MDIEVSGSMVKNFFSLILCVLVIVFFTLYRDDRDDIYFIIGIVSASILAILGIKYNTDTKVLNLPFLEFLVILFFSLYTKYPKDGYYIASMVFLGMITIGSLLSLIFLKYLKSYFPKGSNYNTYKKSTIVRGDGKKIEKIVRY